MEEAEQPAVRGGLLDDLLDLYREEGVRKCLGSPFPGRSEGHFSLFISLAFLAANGQTNHSLFSKLVLGPPFHHTHLS